MTPKHSHQLKGFISIGWVNSGSMKCYRGPVDLLVFGKIPSRVPSKTRLLNSSPLSAKEIELLAQAFLLDTLIIAREASDSRVIFASSPKTTHIKLEEEFVGFSKWKAHLKITDIELIEQCGESFSDRLQNSAAHCHSGKSPGVNTLGGVLVIGTDSPSIAPRILSKALRLVENGKFALGPCVGGGVYAIGIPDLLCSRRLVQLQ